MKRRIVVVDSGIGGLTIYSQFVRHLNCVAYLADNKFFPYGTKSEVELINIIDRIIFYFLNHQYEKVVLACNTASFIYNKYLKYKYKDCVITIFDETVKDLKVINPLNQVGIIATNLVIENNVYSDLIKEKYGVNTTFLATSDLVHLCEKNNKKEIKNYIDKNFHIFKEPKIDALILGCTHFNLLKDEIKEYFNDEVSIICSGYSIVNKFIENDLCLMCNKNIIYLTDYQKNYVKKIKYLFQDVKNIKIQELNI